MPECSLAPKSYSLFPLHFVALLNSIPTYLLNFEFFNHLYIVIGIVKISGIVKLSKPLLNSMPNFPTTQ